MCKSILLDAAQRKIDIINEWDFNMALIFTFLYTIKSPTSLKK